MVSFREHYLLILEPKEFNIHKDCMEYSTLGFVIGSYSSVFEDYLIELISQFITTWQSKYHSAFLKDLKSDISNLVHNSIKGNKITIHTICALSLLTYYIAAMQSKELYLKTFTTSADNFSQFFFYVGINDYSSLEIVEKVRNMTQDLKSEDKRTFFFIHNKYLKKN